MLLYKKILREIIIFLTQKKIRINYYLKKDVYNKCVLLLAMISNLQDQQSRTTQNIGCAAVAVRL